MVNITHVDVLHLATSFPYAYSLNALANASTNHISFISYSDSFVNNVLGPNVTQKLIATMPWEAFHEAGVYNQATGKLYVASNWAGSLENRINVTVIDITNNDTISSLRYPHIAEANGGTAFYPVGTPPNSSEGQQIVFCDEGDLNDHPGQLTLLDPATNKSRVLINNFLGRNFSGPNDVEQHPYTGDLWFTDSRYGYW